MSTLRTIFSWVPGVKSNTEVAIEKAKEEVGDKRLCIEWNERPGMTTLKCFRLKRQHPKKPNLRYNVGDHAVMTESMRRAENGYWEHRSRFPEECKDCNRYDLLGTNVTKAQLKSWNYRLFWRGKEI